MDTAPSAVGQTQFRWVFNGQPRACGWSIVFFLKNFFSLLLAKQKNKTKQKKNIFFSLYIYTHTHGTINFATQSLRYIIHLFFTSCFLFKTFLLTTPSKNKTKKPFFLPISPHLQLHLTFSFISFFPLYFLHYSLLHRYTFHHFLFLSTWLFFFQFYLYKFYIIPPIQSIFFPQKKKLWVLSLSLSFSLSLSLSLNFCSFFITLIKVDVFWKKKESFLVLCFFNFPS